MNTKIGADDDGAAIFWRSEKLRLVGGPSFLSLPSYIPKTAVRVELARVSDGARLNVVCAHLASGDKGSHEAARLNEVGVLMPWLGASIAAAPTIFCLDANSSPDRREQETVWKALHSTGLQSVWDSFFAADGSLLVDKRPSTTNKMRGPLSGQRQKMGEHMLGAIDHLYFSQSLRFVRHAWGPVAHKDPAMARQQLIPSLAIPSDHYPLVAELVLHHPSTSSCV